MPAITTNNLTYNKYGGNSSIPTPIQDNGDGTYSEVTASNQDLTGLTLTAVAAGTTNSPLFKNLSGKGVKVVIDITAISGTTPTLTVTVQGYDPTSGKYYNILSSAGLAAVATTVIAVYPGLAAAANVTANDVVPRQFRVQAVVAGTTPSVTATIGIAVIE